MDLVGKRVLLIIGGGIAAYKCLELIRRLRDCGAQVRAILTEAGSHFVTPLSVSALTGEKIYQDLFDLTAESEMGHIALSRAADLVIVAPATADLIAKLAAGLAPDLASTALLATDKPVLIAPAMNVRMWNHAATQRNIATLKVDGIHVIGPNDGEMACGEFGPGRMAEPSEILGAIAALIHPDQRLAGLKAILTAGPTYEPIDPVRYIANRSSGKQGYAIASALADAGAQTVLVSGPVELTSPARVKLVRVETAREMWAACEAELPADLAICAAAVADWRAESTAASKLKKRNTAPTLALVENPDILAGLSRHASHRPKLVIGFAAETDDIIANASTKRLAKGCDWIIANDVATNAQGASVMGSDHNRVHLLTANGAEAWPELTKAEVARRLVDRIAASFGRAAA
ncbi:MAG TPA: bifunctional phosphopantothenoylcysteine decarboxylase/phosphopantothenate--cysteine ligase CoaBC [Micropepsaceae bacterium]|nr:bifunctional phosphopantothenoylcysteine decarboxylase/phosphopantothenate--cysteine ligase CoaBC [Micropepsaceae bacterium]